MIINNEIRIKYETKRKHELYLILNSVQRNLENHDKKENGKKKQRKNQERTDSKEERKRIPRI